MIHMQAQYLMVYQLRPGLAQLRNHQLLQVRRNMHTKH